MEGLKIAAGGPSLGECRGVVGAGFGRAGWGSGWSGGGWCSLLARAPEAYQIVWAAWPFFSGLGRWGRVARYVAVPVVRVSSFIRLTVEAGPGFFGLCVVGAVWCSA